MSPEAQDAYVLGFKAGLRQGVTLVQSITGEDLSAALAALDEIDAARPAV